MSGDHDDIRSGALSVSGEDPHRRIALDLLLANLWANLAHGLFENGHIRVAKGSGMGLRHNGGLP